MNRIHVLLLDDDREYSNALGIGLSNQMDDCFITVATPSTDLIHPGTNPLILATSGCIASLDPSVPRERIICMTEDPVLSEENGKQIYKYQSVSQIASEIRLFFAQLEGRGIPLQRTGTCKVFAFFSPFGGSGQTAAAITLARVLSGSMGKRVLYLNGETVNTSFCYLSEQGASNRTFSDFIFHLFQKEKSNEAPWAKGYLLQDVHGIHYFQPSYGINAFCGLSSAETLSLIDTLKTQCQMDLILVDLEAGLKEQTQAVLLECDGILLMEGEDPVSQWKKEKLAAILEQMLTGRSRTVILSVLLPRDPLSFVHKGNVTEILLHQEYGAAVLHLAEQVNGWVG